MNALRDACERQGTLPLMNLYNDNGREYLTFDFGGLGHRAKKTTASGEPKFQPLTIMERMEVKMVNAIATGMRRGELCALRWNDLHGGGAVTVQHSRSSVLGQGIVESSTKNHRTRIVVIPELVHDYMGELFLEQAREGRIIRPDDYIFSTAEGPAHPDSFTRRLRRLYEKNGFPHEYHLHTLRHFFATYLLQNNTSKQVAADLLGHADTSFLERTYCHPQLESKQQAASILESMLEPAEQEAWEKEQREAQRVSAAN